MTVEQKEAAKMISFLLGKREKFQQNLRSEAVTVAAKINDILEQGNIDLLKNAEKLVIYVIEQKENELICFAQQEGIAWAKHSLTLSLKLEWVQAIRRTLWRFLSEFEKEKGDSRYDQEYFIELEKRINDNIDKFLNTFFLSYSDYKEEQLTAQRKLVEHLSVPIIPVSFTVAVLPLIGMLDTFRIQTIEEKIFQEIAKSKFQILIIDLSGIAEMEFIVIDHFQKILTGVSMMGCKTVVTGLRPDLVRKMIHSGITFDNNAETYGTLQQTLNKYLGNHKPSVHTV